MAAALSLLVVAGVLAGHRSRAGTAPGAATAGAMLPAAPLPAATPATLPPAGAEETPPATPAPAPPVVPPFPAPYQQMPTEVHGDAKAVAAAVVERLTNYDPGAALSELATEVAPGDEARQGSVAEAAQPLHHPGRWSRGAVVYPQLGGMRGGRASVMVVVRQEVGNGSRVELNETRTLDVRLVRAGGTWTFDELASAGGERVPRPADLPPEAAAVVDHPGIELPDSSRWDIYRGAVSPTLLRVMADLAGRTPYGVVVLESGHPFHVFGTARVSAHTRGRAVDVYRVGDTRVVDGRGRGSDVHRLTSWLYTHPDVSQLGSPWALDGRGGRSFTDQVHQDHLHIAVRR